MIVGVSASPAAAMILRAVAVPPVKVILATSGWETSAAPTSGPNPVTTFSTPSGRISLASRANSTTLGEANSDGFSTTVLPAASAGPTLLARVMIGEFQGIRAPITPSGSRTE